MLRELQVANQAGLSPQDEHCHQYLAMRLLTRHKISDSEPTVAAQAAKARIENTQNVSRSLARGSLHRLVR